MTGKGYEQQFSSVYRENYGRLCAALLSVFQLRDFGIAEDIVQDSFLAAYTNWEKNGLPDNPYAWLKKTCKNRTINFLTRNPECVIRDFYLTIPETVEMKMDHVYLENEITDRQVQLLFTCCHPALSLKAQLVFTLKTLGSFTNEEIARGLGSTPEATGKLWKRTREKIQNEKIPLVTPFVLQSGQRLEAVHTVLYLLFNEGYSATTGDRIIKKDLCLEAIRLTKLIIGHRKLATPDTCALMALMLFHFARFESRVGKDDEPIDLKHQDRALWDEKLIQMGMYYHKKARGAPRISRWVVEAAIAYIHATSASFEKTDWTSVVNLYRLLLQRNRDNVFIKLNLLIARYYQEGPQAVIADYEVLGSDKRIKDNQYYLTALGKMYNDLGMTGKAREAFEKALGKTKLKGERLFISNQINAVL